MKYAWSLLLVVVAGFSAPAFVRADATDEAWARDAARKEEERWRKFVYGEDRHSAFNLPGNSGLPLPWWVAGNRNTTRAGARPRPGPGVVNQYLWRPRVRR